MDILAEMIKGFKRLTLQSTINNYAYYNSDEDDAESDPKINQLVATHTSDVKKRKVTDNDTTNGNSQHLLSINRLIPKIIPVIIPKIDLLITDGVATSRETLHARQTITSKEIVTDVARSGAHVFQDPTVVNWNNTDGTIPRERNTSGSPPIFTTPVRIGGGPSVSPTRTGRQDIGSPSGTIGPVEVRNAQPLHTSINGIYDEHREPAPNFSKVIGCKLSEKSSVNVYSRCRTNFTRDAVHQKSKLHESGALVSPRIG